MTKDYNADQVIGELIATTEFTYSGSLTQQVASTRVLTATGVNEPYETVSFNDAVFGQVDDSFGIYGGGNDLWGSTNEFGAIYLDDALIDGTSVTTKVIHQEDTWPWARAGIIARDDLTENGSAGYVNIAITPGHGCVFSWDSNDDGYLDSFAANESFDVPIHIRLTRSGSQFTGHCSTDGTDWTEVGSATIDSTANMQDVGLFMSAVNVISGEKGIVGFNGFPIGNSSPDTPLSTKRI